MQNIIYSGFIENAINSSYALILVIIVGLSTYYIVQQYYDSERKRKQLRNRTLYLCCLVYTFLLAKIWVEGFTQLLAVLGLVSAALVITNKETIMNLVGWLIINWREIFTEGDLVQIDKNKGYVKYIGPLYITMEETIEQSGNLKTGRILKIPNNHIILHSTVNYNYDSRPILQKHELMFKPNSDINLLNSNLKKIILDITQENYSSDTQESTTKNDKKIKSDKSINYHISCSLKHGNELMLEVIIYFYCHIDNYENVKINFITKLLDTIKNTETIQLI